MVPHTILLPIQFPGNYGFGIDVCHHFLPGGAIGVAAKFYFPPKMNTQIRLVCPCGVEEVQGDVGLRDESILL